MGLVHKPDSAHETASFGPWGSSWVQKIGKRMSGSSYYSFEPMSSLVGQMTQLHGKDLAHRGDLGHPFSKTFLGSNKMVCNCGS